MTGTTAELLHHTPPATDSGNLDEMERRALLCQLQRLRAAGWQGE